MSKNPKKWVFGSKKWVFALGFSGSGFLGTNPAFTQKLFEVEQL